MKIVVRVIGLILCWTLCPHCRLAHAQIPGDNNGDGYVDNRDAIILQENWHRGDKNPAVITISLPAIRMVRIPAGLFMMGSPDTERIRDANEGPLHEVTIDYAFYMSETEVTQGQWEAVMGYNAATHSPDGTPWSSTYGVENDIPVYNVSWNDCQTFLAALNALGQGTFRLPSEAEWEYACRAGTTTRFYFGDSLGCEDECQDCDAAKQIIVDQRSDYMWYCGNTTRDMHLVRQRFANLFGLYDMSGNLYEWCQDTYHADYTGAPADGSAWEDNLLLEKVIRGGSGYTPAGRCRSAFRYNDDPDTRNEDTSFRIVKIP